MPNRHQRRTGDPTPVAGGHGLPSHLVADFPCDDNAPADDLGRQAYWLLKMNSDKVSLRFREADIDAMDDVTKRQLIADLQDCLGIAPLKKVTI